MTKVLHVRSLWACEHDVEVDDDAEVDEGMVRDQLACTFPELVDLEID